MNQNLRNYMASRTAQGAAVNAAANVAASAAIDYNGCRSIDELVVLFDRIYDSAFEKLRSAESEVDADADAIVSKLSKLQADARKQQLQDAEQQAASDDELKT